MMIITKSSKYSYPQWQAMSQWFTEPLGQYLLREEQKVLEPLLSHRFGYHLLELGCANISLSGASPMGHKFSFCPIRCTSKPPLIQEFTASARPEALPLSSNSIDLVLLHHTLDYSDEPHRVLREVERVLIAGGHLIIVGFNPLSIWGIRRLFNFVLKLLPSTQAPWLASQFSSLRIADWLQLLDFQLEHILTAGLALPVNKPGWVRYTGKLDRRMENFNTPLGAFYVIAATKQVSPMTLIKKRWHTRLVAPITQRPIANKPSTAITIHNNHKK
jgi:SAM-dependent methyltransferase